MRTRYVHWFLPVTLFSFYATQQAPASPRPAPPAEPEPVLRIETDAEFARISVLSWDTEGGDRAKMGRKGDGSLFLEFPRG